MAKIKKIDTQTETALLKSLSNRDNYDKYIKYVDIKRVLPNTSTLLKDYKRYYDKYTSHNDIDFGKFYTEFAQDWHVKDLEQQDIDYYRDYVFPAISNCPAGDAAECTRVLIDKQHVEEIANCVQEGLDVSKLRQIIDTYEKMYNINLEEDVSGTIRDADFSVLDKSKGIPWCLPSLQRCLMSLTNGQFVIFSGDSNSGKSALAMQQVAHTLKHNLRIKSASPILYYTSEGTREDAYGRQLSCLYKDKVTGGFEEIVERIDEIATKFEQTFGLNALRVFHMHDVPTFEAVERQVMKYKPCLVIVDICDKLAKEEDVTSLKKLYDNLRVLSGVTCPIIGTSQSGDTSFVDEKTGEQRNQKWLGASKTYGSKSGKQGAADTIVTIGKENEESMLRYIYTPKQKRGEQVKITCILHRQYSFFEELTL